MDSTTKPSKFLNFKKATSKREKFLATYRQSQPWPFPDSLIYYITKNPSSKKGYEKMIRSCKHFFINNPILVMDRIKFMNTDNQWCTKVFVVHEDIFKPQKLLDLEAITSKIWVTEKINISSRKSNLLLPVISKIYQSDIKNLGLYDQDIFFNDLQFLASKVQVMLFSGVTVIDKNGDVVGLAKIIENFPCLNDFFYFLNKNASKIVSSKAVQELLKVLHLSNLTHFELHNIPEVFDIDTFYDYIKENQKIKICLAFSNKISDDYAAHLQGIVDEIIQNDNRQFKTPYFEFDGITSSRKLRELYYAN